MTVLAHDPDHATRGVARLIDRYRKPRTSALLASWLDEVQEVEDALWQLLVERWLDSAEGVQLDVLGRIVGEPRRGRDDDVYRVWIGARNMVSRSSGTTSEMLAIARRIIAPTDVIRLEEYYPAAFVVRLEGTFTLDSGYQIAFMLRQAKAAGVLFQMTWSVAGLDTFRFAPGDTPVPSSPHGFDDGAWAVVADGSFIPSIEELPAGALVIDGVPLTIDGAFLVITPPASLMAPAAAPARLPARSITPLKPLIAKPALVVPRFAPMPLVAETIELEDAFADASLEMDGTGQLFRVAKALQAAVSTAQAAADTAQAAADAAALAAAAAQAAADAAQADADAAQATATAAASAQTDAK